MGGKLKKPPCSIVQKKLEKNGRQFLLSQGWLAGSFSFLEPGVEVEVEGVVDVEVMDGRIITLRKGPMSLME